MPKKPKIERTPKGLTVPVPSRDEFFTNLKGSAKPQKNQRSTPRGAQR
jgi:hypothetical protein